MPFIVHDYPVVTSTNDEAKSLLREGASEGTVIRAMRQTAGRGRRGRQWVSEPGNLYSSFILMPQCPLTHISQLSFVIAVAVGQTILPYLTMRELLSYKWPNDLLLEGKKMAGILIEIEPQEQSAPACIVGIGININSSPHDLAYSVTALNCHTKLTLTPETVFYALLEQINQHYTLWRQEGFDPLRAQWMQRAHGLGQTMTAKVGAQEMSGEFIGLSPEGKLLLKGSDGFIHKLTSAEIY